jgi:hypothetical protein
MYPTRCRCTFGPNPSCPVDHDAESEAIAERRDGKLADLEWVARTVAELPQLSYSRPWSRITEAGKLHSYPGDFRGTASLTVLLRGSDDELLALAKSLRAAVVAEAQSEAEQERRDAEDDDRWAA